MTNIRETLKKLKELLSKSDAKGWSYEPGDPDGELVATTMSALPALLDRLEKLEKVAELCKKKECCDVEESTQVGEMLWYGQSERMAQALEELEK